MIKKFLGLATLSILSFASTQALAFNPSSERTLERSAVSNGVEKGVKKGAEKKGVDSAYADLLNLFAEWRNFEHPAMKDGAPDYSKAARLLAWPKFKQLQSRLLAMNTKNWPISQQIDWKIVRAEMNGYDFNQRVLQPWVRDPAFYQSIYTEASDTPAREGPTNHASVEVWRYQFPLSAFDQEKLAKEIAVIAPLLKQAKMNLTSDARDLWIAGMSTMEQQVTELQELQTKIGANASTTLQGSIASALEASSDFVVWLHEKAASKRGPSGVGKENYSWYQQNVHMVPMTWQQEVDLLQRELDRAWANLKLEEQRNRSLPPMTAATTPEEFNARANTAASKLMRFLAQKEVMPIKPNMEPAIREHLQSFVPEEKRNFFSITLHYDPLALYCHWYHWFDLAQMRDEPHASMIRRTPLLYNLWDNRNEGVATGVEEMFMHMGLHDDSPRSRELVWILLAQRAARGLGSLYAHANIKNMEEASRVHLDWTTAQLDAERTAFAQV